MAVVLLHEHELRVGHSNNASMLTGLGVRMAQALQIGLESCPDLLCTGGKEQSVTTKESRRRLMWSIYIMESWTGSAVVNEAAIGIQLPCSDRSLAWHVLALCQHKNPK